MVAEAIGVQFPLQLDVGYRFNRKFFVGVYAQYALGLLGSTLTCGSGASCYSYAGRVGGEFQFHPLGRVRIDPWVGVGVGYELVSLHGSDSSSSLTVTAQGWEFARVDGGVDFALSGVVRLGPFVGFSIAQFDSANASGSGGSISSSFTNKALHFWISIGVKLTLLP